MINQETGEMLLNLDQNSMEVMVKYADDRIGIDELIINTMRTLEGRQTRPVFLRIEIYP